MQIEPSLLSVASIDGLRSDQQKRLIAILENSWKNPLPLSFEQRQALLSENLDLGSHLIDALEGLSCLSPISSSVVEPRLEHSQIGGFQIVSEIGRGGMGVVYAARRLVDNEEVAIKVLPKQSTTTTRLERFQREAKAASSVSHPSIVPVLETGVDQDVYYFAMKRIHGVSLAAWIEHRHLTLGKPFNEESVRSIAKEFALLADGLHQVHRSGILHRDIKPSNLLIDSDQHIWIFDFGLAYVFDGGALTRTGDLIGTFKYMSPEQARGGGEFLDVRTDIYSLGLTLYEALTGHHPFENFEGPALLNAIKNQEPVPPSRFWPKIPKDLETIVMRALRPERNSRYESARQLSQDLNAFANNAAIVAKKVTFFERSLCLLAKYPERIMIGMGLLLASTLGLGIHNAMLQKQKNETQSQWERGNVIFQQARDAVDTLGFDVASKLAGIPGTEELQKEIFRETIDYYHSFLHRSNNDPSLKVDEAVAQWKIAKLVQLSGRRDEFDRSLRLAIASLENAYDSTHDQDILGLLVQARIELAWLCIERSDFDESLTLIEMSSKRLPEFASDHQRQLAASLLENARASHFFQKGDLLQSLACCRSTLLLLDELPVSMTAVISENFNRGRSNISEATAHALSNLAVILTKLEEYALASEAIEKSIVLQKNNRNDDQKRSRALALNNLASLRWRQGDISKSIDAYRESVRLLEETLEQSPGLIGPRKELAITLNNLGLVLSKSGNYFSASDSLERSTLLISAIAESDPSDLDAIRHAAGIWNNYAVAKANLHETAEASQAFEKAVSYQATIVQKSTEDPREQSLLEKYKNGRDYWASPHSVASKNRDRSQSGTE